MNKVVLKQMILPIVIIFFIVTALCLILSFWLDANNVNHNVLLNANVLLFFLGLISAFMHIKSLRSNNPYAFVRNVTALSFIKLIVIAVAVFIYLFTSKENKSIYAVGIAMLLYVIYTIIEVKAAMRLNKDRNA